MVDCPLLKLDNLNSRKRNIMLDLNEKKNRHV